MGEVRTLRRRGYWTRERIFEAAQDHLREHGVPPTRTVWACATPANPHPDWVRKQYGGFEKLRVDLGHHPDAHLFWTEEKIVAALQAWAREHGRTPTRTRDWGKAAPDHPASPTVSRVFGSWNAALAAAGLTPNKPGTPSSWGPEEIAALILDWLLKHGTWPSVNQWDDAGMQPRSCIVERVCGSWHQAKRMAGWAQQCRCCGVGLSGRQRLWCSSACRQRYGKHGPRVQVRTAVECAGCGCDLDVYSIGCKPCSDRRRKRAARTAAACRLASVEPSSDGAAPDCGGALQQERKAA